MASELLAQAAFLEGKHPQSFPFFGVERRGAPVTAFTRIDTKPVEVRTSITEPDIVNFIVAVTRTGPGVPGRRAVRISAPKAPAPLTSVYRHTPTLEWRSLAVGQPSSPGPNLFALLSDGSCQPTSQGLSRVLPVAEGLEARSIVRFGAAGVAMSGLPLGDGPLAIPSGSALAQAVLERTSAQGTSGRSCRPSVFAYVRLGMGRDFEPVSVLR